MHQVLEIMCYSKSGSNFWIFFPLLYGRWRRNIPLKIICLEDTQRWNNINSTLNRRCFNVVPSGESFSKYISKWNGSLIYWWNLYFYSQSWLLLGYFSIWLKIIGYFYFSQFSQIVVKSPVNHFDWIIEQMAKHYNSVRQMILIPVWVRAHYFENWCINYQNLSVWVFPRMILVSMYHKNYFSFTILAIFAEI